MTAAPPNFLTRTVEYFTLRAAEAELERLPELARAEIAEGIALARQQTAAAEALFAVGHTVEALRLGKDALASTEKAAERYARARGLVSVGPEVAAPASESPQSESSPAESPQSESSPAESPQSESTESPGSESPEGAAASEADASEAVSASPSEGAAPLEAPASEPSTALAGKTGGPKAAWRRLAEAAGKPAARIGVTERSLAELDKLVLPRLEKDVAPAHVDAFRDLLRARAEIEDTLTPATHTKGSLFGARIWRGMSAGLLALVVMAGLYYGLRPVEGTFVRASATWADSPDFRPEFIIDGSETSMWLLPQHTGWVEVRVAPAIPEIHSITLVNAGSTAIADRGTNAYRLEIYSGGRLEQTIDGAFGEELGATVTHEVSVSNVERIRFTAESGYRVGSGLSELRWQ